MLDVLVSHAIRVMLKGAVEGAGIGRRGISGRRDSIVGDSKDKGEICCEKC